LSNSRQPKPILAASGLAGAGVTLLFGVVEMAVVAVRREEFLGHVGLLGFQFLDADEVGVLAGYPVEEAFLVGGADTVQVCGDNSWHGSKEEVERESRKAECNVFCRRRPARGGRLK
jgi:hypothetical protein